MESECRGMYDDGGQDGIQLHSSAEEKERFVASKSNGNLPLQGEAFSSELA